MGTIENRERILTGLTFIEAAATGDQDMMQEIFNTVSTFDLVLGVTKGSLMMFSINESVSAGNLSATESVRLSRARVLQKIASEDLGTTSFE